MESRRFRGNLRRWGFSFYRQGTTGSSQHAVFVLSFAAKPSGDILVGTHCGSGFSTQRMIATHGAEKNNGLIAMDVRAIAINPVGTIFAGTAGCGTGVYRSTDNGDSWSLANIGLTSTDVAALAVNGSNYHVFAGTHSIMGKGGGMFRSTDNGDT
jgi:hypothetical protein